MSEGTVPPNADETRVASDLDGGTTLDPTATRMSVDFDSASPGYDPAATRIGGKDQ
jgi:hypothetical protein